MNVLSLLDGHQNMRDICKTLARGGVVVSPSDTTYGILVDATNPQAVEKLIALKERPRGKAISIFTNGLKMAAKYVDITKLTPEIESLLPGTYTIVLPSLHKVSYLLEAEDGTIGIRWVGKANPMAELVTLLVSEYNKPVTATSANISGGGLCYTIDSFLNQLSEKKKQLVDLVIDAGELPHNPPSTVIHLGHHDPKVLRANDRDFIYRSHHVTNSTEETGQIAKKIFELIKPHFGKRSIVVTLDGELGGGKTSWTKHFAKLFGVTGVTSPTYTFENEYEVKSDVAVKRLKHYDLYNITNEEDLNLLRIHEQCTKETVICIEWPGQLTDEDRNRLASNTFFIRVLFEYVNEWKRKVTVWHN